MKKTVKELLLASQSTLQNHGKLVKEMVKIYKATEFGKFWAEFIKLLKRAMIVFEREPAIERIIQFVAKFATSLKNDIPDKTKTKEDTADPPAEEIDEDIHQFLLKLFDFCLKHHNANDKAVRFRVCQLVNKLLGMMGTEAQIDDDLYDRIYDCMLVRLRDLFPIIRIQAVFALARLQDPTDEDCPIINGYLFLLNCDTNSDVRRAVLSCIAASTKTLPALLERTRDVKPNIRRLTYEVLSEKVHIRALTIAQRITILENGLHDHDEAVRESCITRLLQAWLRTFETNLLDLLGCLDVENSLKIAEEVLKALFKKIPAHELVANFDILNEELVIDAEKMSPESVLYWRMLCAHLSGLGVTGYELLEKVLPLPTSFGAFLSKVVAAMNEEKDLEEQLTNDFILHQLLDLAAFLDLSDEAGRKVIGKLIDYLLVSELTTHTIMGTLVARLEQFQKDPVTRINILCEIIADIREPITVVEDQRSTDEKRQIELKLAQVRVKLNQLREELEEQVTKQQFAEAAATKEQVQKLDEEKEQLQQQLEHPLTQEVRTERKDSATLLKCMSIATSMLSTVTFRQIPASLQTLVETLILPGVQNEDPAVRNLAVQALGLCCLLKLDLAKKHLVLFIAMSQLDIISVKVKALQVIFDLLLIFGFETLEEGCEEKEDEDNEKSDQSIEMEQDEDEIPTKEKKVDDKAHSKSLMLILTDLLNSKVSELRTVAAEGLAKLMLAGRIVAPKLISRLLLLWYNPLTEDDTLLRHCLGTFFPIYAFASVPNQAVVEEAILPTLRTLFKAPPSSPLTEIDHNNVLNLLVQLTNARHLLSMKRSDIETTSHDTLAVKLCNEILSELQEEDSCSVRPLCRAFATLELSANHPGLKDLSVLAESINEQIKDKRTKKVVQKFQEMIHALGGDKADSETVIEDATTLSETTVDRSPSRDVPDTTSDTISPTASTAADLTTNSTNSPSRTSTTIRTEETSPDPARTALGPVTQNQADKPEIEADTEEPLKPNKRTTKSRPTAKTTKRTKSQQKTTSQAEVSSSEPENDVHSSPTPVRRSSRATRTKSSQAETAVQSETDSPLRKSMRTTTKREQPKRTKRH